MMLWAMLVSGAWGQAEPPVQLEGFVKPVFSTVVRNASLPEDRLQVGLSGSRAGIVIRGAPLPAWKYRVFFVVGGNTVTALTAASTVDRDNDGVVDGLQTTARSVLSDLVRETSVTWAPSAVFQIRAGQMPVPFTSAAQSADVALLFPERAGPNDLFLAEDDLGALAELQTRSQVFRAKVGVFNGTGTGANGGQQGVLGLARIDLEPLGPFSFDEANPLRTEPRLGIGVGLIVHPYRQFDGVGFPRSQVLDLRASGSVRVGIGGFTLSVEGLHRRQTDDLTDRPIVATGAYAQTGWRLPAGIEPIARAGWAVEDQSFDPRETVWTEGGLNLYPAIRSEDAAQREALRITFAYAGEHRLTEGETAHSGTAALLLRFR